MEEMSQMYNTLEETFQASRWSRPSRWKGRAPPLPPHSKQYSQVDADRRYIRSPARDRVVGVLTIAVGSAGRAYLHQPRDHLLGIRMCDKQLSLSLLLLSMGVAAHEATGRKLFEYSAESNAGGRRDRIIKLIDASRRSRPAKVITLAGGGRSSVS